MEVFMKKVLSLLLIITLICSFCAAFAATAYAVSEQDGCTQCFLKPKEKKPDASTKPGAVPQVTEKPEAKGDPNANQPNTGRSNQPNTNLPDTGRSNRPNANLPGETMPESNRPKPEKPKENPMNTLQKRFDALSDQQRSEVYKITDELNNKFIDLTEKYREIGLLSKQESEQITGILKNGYAMAKASGRVIFALPPLR
jgi:hypothetical protein